jgi:hypothetical protein
MAWVVGNCQVPGAGYREGTAQRAELKDESKALRDGAAERSKNNGQG